MSRPPTARTIVFISRQRIIGRTNGSSAYLLDLAAAVRDAGMIPHLLQPAPTIMGRTPYLRLHDDLAVFARHRVRGVLKLGRHMVSCDPRLYRAAIRGVVARIGRRLGATGAWTRDVPNPYSVAISWTAADHRFIRREMRKDCDVAVADYIFQAGAFEDAPPGTPSAIVMHDLFHTRPDSVATGAVVDSVALVTRDAEVAALGRADAVIAIQQAEAEFVQRHVPDATVIVAPMAARCASSSQPGAGDRLLFVGSNTAPNVLGLQWFFDAVWPLVLAKRPDLRLDIAGTVHRAFAGSAPSNVRFLGLVDNLDAAYASAGIVLSPLTFGSGLKIKLVEAMAHGKAIVATGITLQGVEDASTAVARADTAVDFADEILRLAGDEPARAALAQAALDYARRRFSPQACYGPLLDWLRTAGTSV